VLNKYIVNVDIIVESDNEETVGNFIENLAITNGLELVLNYMDDITDTDEEEWK